MTTDILIEKTSEDAASRSLKVTVPVERVQAAEAKALRYFANQARLPGFRKGKAPDAVVKRRFSDAIRQSALEEVVRDGWETARSAESLEPVTEPSVRNLHFEEGKPVEFELFVEVRPSVTLERTGGFRLTRTVKPVTDEQVEAQLQAIREQRAAWAPVTGERPAPGHQVQVEVTVLDGKEQPTPQTHTIELGEGQTVPDLEELIMALTPGETREGEIRFPEDHPDANLRGESRKIRVALLDVKRKELPALDDELAREVGDFESLAQLRETVRKDLEQDAVREADAAVRDELIRQIADANNVPAPESLVHRVLHAFAHGYGIPEEQLGTFEEQFHPIAERTVRRDLVLTAVTEQEKLRATEEEVDARVAEMARARGVETGQLYAALQKNNRLPEIERALTEEKVFSHLLAQSTVDEGTD
jgi:trigger factor